MYLPGIEEKVAFLSRPEVYPIPTQRVETKETHMSWVFLTDTQAWKLKKPVHRDYFDLSTPAARHRNCREEVRLNRRLAPDVYLGIVSLTIDELGNMHLDGQGEAVDWLVRMRRLPADRMLDRMIANQTISEAGVQQVGAVLARFYRQAQPVEMTAAAYRNRLAADVRANQDELEKPEYALPPDLLSSITDSQLRYLDRESETFCARVRDGKIIEAHGDLRPEHICLESEPVIIDCLEFNRDFRILDPVSELSFLSLECERLGAAWVGQLILKIYSDQTADRPPERLLWFYRGLHACLRAKLAVWHLEDHQDWEKWTGKARDYLRLAKRED